GSHHQAGSGGRPSALTSPTSNRHSNASLQARAGSTNTHPLASSKFIVPQVPVLQSASQAHATNGFAPVRASSILQEYVDDARVGSGDRPSAYQRAPTKPSAHALQQVPKHDALAQPPRKKLSGELPSEMPVWDAAVSRSPEGYLLVPEEVAALNLRQLEMNTYQQCQARAFYNLGLASWLSAKQRSALTLADVTMDEASGLAIQEQQVLLPLIGATPSRPASATQMEEPATESPIGTSREERPIRNSAPSTPVRQVAEVAPRKAGSLPPLGTAPRQQDSSKEAPLTRADSPAESLAAAAAVAPTPALAATISSARTISVAIHTPGSPHVGKAQVLRHRNPLLCSWNALAVCFFRKWHVTEDPTPDFGSSEWISEKLFASATADSAAMIADEFEMAFKDACHDISSDR
ncbi:hypothetical protein GGI06_006075, partial [Coemansia sp. S85]